MPGAPLSIPHHHDHSGKMTRTNKPSKSLLASRRGSSISSLSLSKEAMSPASDIDTIGNGSGDDTWTPKELDDLFERGAEIVRSADVADKTSALGELDVKLQH